MVAKGNIDPPDLDDDEHHYLVNTHLQTKVSSILAAS
jgi:hypothetical protein